MGFGIPSVVRDLFSIKSRISGFYRPNRFLLILMTKNKYGIPVPVDPLIVSAANMPGRSLQEQKLYKNGVEYKYAGAPTFEDLKITITTWHYIDFRAFQAWFDWIWNPDMARLASSVSAGDMPSPKDYKTDAYLGQVGDSGITSSIPLHNMILKGVYPKSIGDVEFSQDPAQEFVKFTVTLSVDSIEML